MTGSSLPKQPASEEETYTPSFVVTLEISEREDAEPLADDIARVLRERVGVAVAVEVEHVPGGYLTIDRSYRRAGR
jgi:hypothetical protein